MMKNTFQTKKIKTTSSHDSLFKHFYSDPKLIQELLQLILSKKELKAYNLKKLKIEKDTFAEQRADLIVSIPFKTQPKVKLEILVLLEHKSFHDKNLFSQLLKYQILIREHSIQQKGCPQPIIPVLFYHGKQPLRWKKSLQEDDFQSLFSKIPIESRKDMLNCGLRIIDTQQLKIRKTDHNKKLKGWGVIKLLSEIWDMKHPTALKIKEVFAAFENILKPLKGKEQTHTSLRILEYLIDNTKLDLKTWQKAEALIVEEGILTKGGIMDIREYIEEKGRQKGLQEGRQEGRQEGSLKGKQQVVLNMLKKKLDIAFISEVTNLPKKAIKKLKNNS